MIQIDLVQVLKWIFILFIIAQPIRIGIYIASCAAGKKRTDVTDYSDTNVVIAKIVIAIFLMGWYWLLWSHLK